MQSWRAYARMMNHGMMALFSRTAESAARTMRSVKNAPPSGALVFHGRPMSEPDLVPEIMVTVFGTGGQAFDLSVVRSGVRVGEVVRGPIGSVTPEQMSHLEDFSSGGPGRTFEALRRLMAEMMEAGVTRDELIGVVDLALASHVMGG